MLDRVLVISTFPPKGETYNHPGSAVASYTKNTLVSILKAGSDFDFKVLADQLNGSESYKEEGIEVSRCWQKNNFSVYSQLLRAITNERSAKKVFLAFEWSVFGRKRWLLSGIPFFLLILKLLGKKVYFVAHGILLDASLVVEQVGIKKNSLSARVYTLGLRFIYWSAVLLCHRVVAFEENLRRQLVSLSGKPEKIVTIPHGVEEVKGLPSKEDSRKKIKISTLSLSKGDILIVCFGFLTWYKGSDWLVKTMAKYFKQNPASNLRLLMVGGATKTYADDPVYQKYINEIKKAAEEVGDKIEITGFVDEKEIASYYGAADLIVFPYRVFVSSSGPLSLAFSYKKPVLLSFPLLAYAETLDVAEALSEVGLEINDFSFQLEERDLIEKFIELIENKRKIEKVSLFSEKMLLKRQWSEIGERYEKLLKS